jgi:hypothetical protein
MLHRTALLTIALSASGLVGCTYVNHHHTHAPPVPGHSEARRGPPPHAPAHGYRHKQHTHMGGVDLIFDSGLGVYVVVGWPDHYWHHDHYYRWVDGGWLISARLDGGWAACSDGRVPPGLVKKHPRAHGKKEHWKHPASRKP